MAQLLLWLNNRDHGSRRGADIMPDGGRAKHQRMYQDRFGTMPNVSRTTTVHGSDVNPWTALRRVELVPASQAQAASSSSGYAAYPDPNYESWTAWAPDVDDYWGPWRHAEAKAPPPADSKGRGKGKGDEKGKGTQPYNMQAGWQHRTPGAWGSAQQEAPHQRHDGGDNSWDRGDGGGGWGRSHGDGGGRGAGGWDADASYHGSRDWKRDR